MKATVHALALAALMSALGSSTHAQTNTTGEQHFVSNASQGEWRASKLVGVAIYGPDNKSIGKVSDIIIDGSGTVKALVVGVGGFLGVGQKDVGLPFTEVKWSDQPVVEPTPAPATAMQPTPPANSSSIASTNQNAAPSATTLPGSSAVTPPRTTVYDYPDHGTVSLTKDELKAAPDFHYASGKS
ncbi:MAG: PRC-barrel domain-containing protein [Hyphomicrobiales bacterium]|nr:PRC-barrel domain-containing protein [Hyphomicrobiales bacterium]MBV9111406.1 PRC-barrel domain-containing protein [Hyphomicrobiales bacterium]MBV9516850.1 PRC-barrel domain-containing protein [Hyphomicrobiales bacterium]